MRRRLIKNSGDFDPFEFNHIYRGIRTRQSSLLLLVGLAMVVGVVIVTTLEGTFGALSDFQLVDDVLRIVGLSGPPWSAPQFPLIRDVASWLLLFTVIFGGVALHRQWRLMAECLSGLTASGALIAKKDRRQLSAGKGLMSKILRLNKLIDTSTPDDALRALVDKVMKPMRKVRIIWSLSVGLLSAVLAGLLILGQKHGLFQTFAPRNLSQAERQSWLNSAYDGWWAGDSHLAGHITYGLFAFIALFIILSFNSVGLIAIYVVLALKYVAQPSADWLNRDGRYGWTPLAKVYRTVLLGVALLSMALTVTLAVLGLDNFPWISFLLVMYALAVPLFVIVPRLVFRKAEEIARNERIEEIVAGIQARGLYLDHDFDQIAPFLAEIDRCRQARIRPFRLRRASFSSLAFVYVLPVALGVAQVVSPLSFGAR